MCMIQTPRGGERVHDSLMSIVPTLWFYCCETTPVGRTSNMEVDSSYSYHACRVMLDPVCNVPISGESRETKDFQPPYGNS